MKVVKQKDDICFDVKWNANFDGSVIVQAFEEEDQSQIICKPFHIQCLFDDLLRLMKIREDRNSRKYQIYSEMIRLLTELRSQ